MSKELSQGKKIIAMADRNGVEVSTMYKLLNMSPLALHGILWRGIPVSCKTAIELETIFFGVAEDWVSEDQHDNIAKLKLKDKRFVNVNHEG